MRKAIIIFLLFLVVGSNRTLSGQTDMSNLEIPKSPKGYVEVILKRTNYIVSFNARNNIPNWVAWHLNKKKLVEKVSRKGYRFSPDPNIREDKAIITQDYSNTGYDRGHMCPAGDCRWSAEAMKESFYMTNICPQNPNLNGGDWHELENKCRNMAMEETVYIVCGPILYKKPLYQSIGKKNNIRVPEAFFKVILTGLEKGKPRAIGFIFKNTSGNNPLYSYVNSIDQVERITGLDFFSSLPDKIEEKIEREYNLTEWQ